MITRQLLETIARENAGGFTIKGDGTHVKSGYAVAMTNGINGHNEMSVEDALGTVSVVSDWCIGGWLTDTNELMIDVVLVTDNLDDAIEIGNAHKQLAIYDLTNDKQINL